MLGEVIDEATECYVVAQIENHLRDAVLIARTDAEVDVFPDQEGPLRRRLVRMLVEELGGDVEAMGL